MTEAHESLKWRPMVEATHWDVVLAWGPDCGPVLVRILEGKQYLPVITGGASRMGGLIDRRGLTLFLDGLKLHPTEASGGFSPPATEPD